MRSCLTTMALCVLLQPAAAWAQQPAGFDAHGFQLAAHDGDPRDPLAVQRPGAFVQGDGFFSVLSEYARAPLVQVSEAALSGQVVETPVLDHLVALNISTGIAAHERLRFDIKAPVYLVSADGVQEVTEGPAPGDIRGSAMVMAVRPRHVVGGGGFGLALIGHVDIPSGTPDRFLGQQGVAGGASLAATYEFAGATLSAELGSQFNPSVDLANLTNSDNLVASFAIGGLASEHVGLTAEIVAQPPFEPVDRITFPAEALGSVKYRDPNAGLFWTFGGAAGLTSGPGVAAFRAFLGLGYARIQPPRAADFDPIGAFAIRDECPLEPETANGWMDEDGCPDSLGALSIEVRYRSEPYEAVAQITGPSGTTEERITTSGMQRDALPGSRWSVKAESGNCLIGEGAATVEESGTALGVELYQRLDSRAIVEVVSPDLEPIPTATVVWEGELNCLPNTDVIPVGPSGSTDHAIGVGTHHLRVTADGYSVHEEDVAFEHNGETRVRVVLTPSLVKITKEQIEILEKVHFETAAAVIKPESFGLLDEVAATITTNPDLGRVEVGGHTDSRGSDQYNLDLSKARAAAVVAYLVRKGGVASERLIATGFGETLPLDTNKTPEGREANRRVEFALIDRAPAAEGEGSP